MIFLGEAGLEVARLELKVLRVLNLFRLFPPVNLGFDMDPPAQSTVALG